MVKLADWLDYLDCGVFGLRTVEPSVAARSFIDFLMGKRQDDQLARSAGAGIRTSATCYSLQNPNDSLFTQTLPRQAQHQFIECVSD